MILCNNSICETLPCSNPPGGFLAARKNFPGGRCCLLTVQLADPAPIMKLPRLLNCTAAINTHAFARLTVLDLAHCSLYLAHCSSQ